MSSAARAVFVCLFLAIALPGSAQVFQPYFQHFTADDGLPSSEVYYALQDREGYMWFGTDNGVARFDGHTFRVYGNEEGLEDNVVFKILEDEDGTIWVSTYSGSVFYYEGGLFHAFRHNPVLRALNQKHSIIKLEDVDFSAGFLFSAQSKGLFYLNRFGEPYWINRSDSTKIYLYQSQRQLIDDFTPNRIEFGADFSADTFRHDLLVFDHAKQDWRKEGTLRKRGWIQRVVFQNLLDEILIITGREVIVWKDTAVQHFVNTKYKPCNYAFPHSKRGYLLCRGTGGGLEYWVVDYKGELKKKNVLLAGQSIAFGMYDRQGGLWLISSDAGIFYAAYPELPNFRLDQGTMMMKPRSIAIVSDSVFYAGYADGSIYHHNYRSNQRFDITSEQQKYSFKIFSLEYDSLRHVLYSNRFYYYPFAEEGTPKERLRNYSIIGSKNTFVREIHARSLVDDNQLLFTKGSAFGYFDLLENQAYIRYDAANSKRKERLTFHCYYIDHQGRHWLGSLHGLMQYKPSLGVLGKNDLGQPALQRRVEEIRQLPDGAMVFGTRGSGVVYHSTDTSYVIDAKAGLASNNIRDLHLCKQGMIWVATLEGLSKLRFTAQGSLAELRTFRKAHGLPSNEIYDISSRDNKLWLVTSNGIVAFTEPAIENNSPPPVLYGITVNGHSSDRSALSDLAAWQNHLEIDFRTINYQLGKEVDYRYRLGPDKPWQFTRQGSVNFPRLQSGTYRFEAQSQNQDGIWSESLLLPIEIATPWYAYHSVQFVSVLVLIAGIAGFFYQRDQRRKQDQAYAQQIDRLERAALHAQMNPHFVFNSLNSIQHFILQNDTKQAVYYLARFAQLIRDTLRVSVRGKHNLSQEIQILENYIGMEKLRFKESFDYRITLAEHLDADKILLPTLLIQPLVENAIMHGLQERESGGLVEIDFAGSAQELRVSIRDNGSGFVPDQSNKSDSMGMDITRRRLKIMRQRAKTPDMEIHPLYNTDGKLIGTEIIIFIQTFSA